MHNCAFCALALTVPFTPCFCYTTCISIFPRISSDRILWGSSFLESLTKFEAKNLVITLIRIWIWTIYMLNAASHLGSVWLHKKKKKWSKCKMLVQMRTVHIYAIMYFDAKIWSDEGKFKLSKFESKQFRWIIINLISCGMFFHWATLLTEETRIERVTLP